MHFAHSKNGTYDLLHTLSLRFCVNNFAVHVQMFTQLIMKIIPDLHIQTTVTKASYACVKSMIFFFRTIIDCARAYKRVVCI